MGHHMHYKVRYNYGFGIWETDFTEYKNAVKFAEKVEQKGGEVIGISTEIGEYHD